MKKLLSDKRGSLTIILIGLLFCILLLTFLVIEMGSTYYRYEQAQAILQRAANSAVESNIDDRYRADKDLRLKTLQAQLDFRTFVLLDFPDNYTVKIKSVSTTTSPPSLTAKGTIRFKTVFSQFGFRDVTFNFTVRSTNYDLK